MKPRQVLVLVPSGEKSDVHHVLAPGSAIVAPIEDKESSDIIATWYEEPGNAANVVTFEDRLTQAAGRLAENYPTSKMTGFERSDIAVVAIAEREEGNGWYISQIIDHQRLQEWAGENITEGGSAQFIRNRISRGFNRKTRG